MATSYKTDWPLLKNVDQEFIVNIDMIMRIGPNAALIVTKQCKLYGIGTNSNGRLGIDEIEEAETPVEIDIEIDGVKDLINSERHVMLLTTTGEVYTWGYNKYGQLGDGTVDDSYLPISVENMNDINIVDIACTKHYSLALTDEGVVYEWGRTLRVDPMYQQLRDIYGESSDDSQAECHFLPLVIPSFDKIIIRKIACGYDFAVALDDKGTVYGWGDNSRGQLGIPKKDYVMEPTEIKVLATKRITNMAASNRGIKCVFLDNLGDVYTWYYMKSEEPYYLMRVLCSGLYEALEWYNECKFIMKTFEYESRNSTLVDYLARAFDDPETSDLIIKVHDQPIYVHKSILMIRSSYFRKMFQDEEKLSSGSVVINDEFSYDALKAFLKYLYTNQIDLSADNAIEFLGLANTYMATELKNKYIEILMNDLKVKNTVSIYSASVIHNVKELEDFAFLFFINHMTSIVKSREFRELSYDLMMRLLARAADARAFKY